MRVMDYRFTFGKGMIFSEVQLRDSILNGYSHFDITLVFNIWMAKFTLAG